MTASRYLTTHTSPVADPYVRLEVPSYPGCTRTRYRLDERKTETISPGIYCGGIEVAGGATLSLDPGTYILDRGNFAVSGNGTVKGTGVTLVLTSRTGSNYGAIAGPRRQRGNPGNRYLGRWRSAGHRRHLRRRQHPEYQRCDLSAWPAGQIFRRLILCHSMQPTDRPGGYLHRKFLFQA